ncbi:MULTISPECIES: DUF4328 domain-containing protein [Pseudonocardia]|uniref:DUF4328 domain-containing protein n=1 Tax=Pseudonocardia alni TaxID=33907 RepID=A0A852W2V1_PSEA5|nr:MULTISPECIES: DUF4328 domain-containing protein [Pseudonocardia]MCO7197445.1 DUF4328 domain-containing protein [Pseudonocardia sp. McavD-2-B]NYG02730.1 hypothetical protein [Pseudonocardia antarctica]
MATTPGGPAAEPTARRDRYAGPPRYRAVPRWGLPVGPWRIAPVPGEGPLRPVDRARALAAQLVPVLWVVVVVSGVAAVAEVWRYVLLLFSRSDALSPEAVGVSDALVWFGGWSSVVATIAAGVLMISWSVWTYRAAADRSGTRAWRSRRRVVAGWVVPGWNLVAPGSLLAETEHAALDLPPERRPSPSRELLVWWALWAACVVLGAVVLVWRFRTGTQALADGVVLHAWADVLAAVTAWRTIRVVRLLTALLATRAQGPRQLLVSATAGTAGAEPAVPVGAAGPQAAPTAAPVPTTSAAPAG